MILRSCMKQALKAVPCLSALLFLLAFSGLATAEPLTVQVPAERLEPFFTTYCVDCHGPDDPEGQVRLDSVSLADYEQRHGAALAGSAGRSQFR